MAFFNFDSNITNATNFYNNNSNIECISCSNSSNKLLRCSCCNEIINLNDLLNHLNKNNNSEIIKLVKFGSKPSIRISVKNLYHITKFLKDNNTKSIALNFTYKIHYMGGVNNDNGQSIKMIQNIEYNNTLQNFKQEQIELKYLIMCANIPTNAEVLISIHDLNVFIPQL